MKKRHSIQILLAVAAIFFAATACTQDELTDDTRLPEGQYPLQIAAVTLSVEGGEAQSVEGGEAQPWGAPQTRVSENGDGTGSKWDGGEKIDVQIEGSTETATYIVQAGGTVTSNAPLYWSDRDNHTVNAWYPATNTPLDLSDQTNGFAYLLHGTGTGNYEKPVELIFTHSLAKVRVTPSKDIANGEVTSLQLYTYTQCTHNQGNDVQGATPGWIKMKKCEYTDNGTTITCWEANVVPDYEITKLRANGNEERTLSSGITPVAGKFYNITLNKDLGYTEVSEGNYTVDNEKGLKNLAELVNNGATDINITLTGNITLTEEWTPIGIDDDHQYTGAFDGDGHTISELTMTGSDEYAGLFGYIGSDGMVKNVKLEKVQIASDYQYGYVGGMAGINNGTIENCSVSGRVSGYSAGGVVGQQYSGSITLCNSSATVQGTSQVGGVVGYTNYGVTLTACYATGNVTAENNNTAGSFFAGGVVGSNGGNLTACYATGIVTGGTGSIYVGGVTGDNASGTLTACYHAAETVSGLDGATTGGVTGRNYDANVGIPSITACYWQNNQAQGIGNNQAGTTDETTQVTDGDWQNAVTQMNAALSGKGWQYELKDGNSLPTLKKEQ